jgi:hypothetical protein
MQQLKKIYLNFFSAVWIFFKAGDLSAIDPRIAIRIGNQNRFKTQITIFIAQPPVLRKPGPGQSAKMLTAGR